MNDKTTMILDAQESVYFTRELEVVKARSYDTKYRENRVLSMLPLSVEANPNATEITWRRYTKVGSAIQYGTKGNNVPRADAYGEEFTSKIFRYISSYGYNVFEIRTALWAKKPLDSMKASATRMSIDNLLNDIAAKGDTKNGLKGFINRTDVSTYTVTSGTSGLKTWTNKTSDEILFDLNSFVNSVVVSTVGVETPDTLLLPQAQYNYIMQKRLGDGSDRTILSYFMENNKYIKRVDWLYELDGAGDTATDRMICYVNSPEKLTMELPVPFEQHEVERKGFDYEVPCSCSTAGVLVYYPNSICYADGI
jgi:hypothetical protein